MNNLLDLLFEQEQNSIPYQVYCDMDGVLCDFESRFEHFTGISPQEYKDKAIIQYGEKKGMEKFWDVIDNQIGVRFWRGMSWMPEGRQLWDYIKQYKPILLTSPSQKESSKKGKKMWIHDNLGDYDVIFKKSSEKYIYSSPNNILIDDREDNIMDWKLKNGIGILYKGNTQEVIRELQKIGI